MLSVIVGIIVSALSVWGMICWYQDLFVFLKGMLPLGFFLGGLVAIIAGVSSFRKAPVVSSDKSSSSQENPK